jgi:hypothetical protein
MRMGDLDLARTWFTGLYLAPEAAQYWVTLGVVAEQQKDDNWLREAWPGRSSLTHDGLAWYNYATRGVPETPGSCPMWERAAALRRT